MLLGSVSTQVYGSTQVNEVQLADSLDEIVVVDGKVIINLDYGYAVEVTFEPGTTDEAIQLIVRSAKKVINDTAVQREATAIFVATGSAYKAAKFIAGKVIREITDSVIVSIRLIQVD